MAKLGIAVGLALLGASVGAGVQAVPLRTPGTKWESAIHSQLLAQALDSKRSALVIGNGAYEEERLANAVNDAEAVTRALQEIGFVVTLVRNADKRTIDEAVESFSRRLAPGELGLFYFSGHGVQVEGENYLVPINARLNRQADSQYDAVPLGKVINAVEASNATTRIIILDACRNNPFYRRWRSSMRSSGNRGLATPVNSGTGTFIAFSTAPGKEAADGIGVSTNSPFTTYLLRHIKTPNLEVGLLFRQVRDDVVQATQNKQVPWDSNSLGKDLVYLNPVPSALAVPAVATQRKSPNPDAVVAVTMPDGRRAYGPLFLKWPLKPSGSGVSAEIKAEVYINSQSVKGTVELKFKCNSSDIQLMPVTVILTGANNNPYARFSKEIASIKADACPLNILSPGLGGRILTIRG